MDVLSRWSNYQLNALGKRAPNDELGFMVAEGGADLLQKWNHGDKESKPVPSDMRRFFPNGMRLLFVFFAKEPPEQPIVLDSFEVFAEFLAADAEIFQGALEVVSGFLVVQQQPNWRVLVV